MFKQKSLSNVECTTEETQEISCFLDILKQLIRTPSVVGAEHPFFLFLQEIRGQVITIN
jgi:hypothetical protein